MTATAQPELPEWATDGTQIVDPPSGLKTTGFPPNVRLPAQYLNAMLGLLGWNPAGGVGWAQYLALGLTAGLVWSGRLWSVGGTNGWNGSTITPLAVWADSIERLFLSNAVLTALSAHEFVITELDTYAGPGTRLTANSIYYLYVSYTGSAIAYQISIAAPVDGAISGGGPAWKNGSVGTVRYLGWFATDASGNPLPFRAAKGKYVYRLSEFVAPQSTNVVNATVTTGTTAQALTALVPNHARLVDLRLTLGQTTLAGGAAAGYVGTHGGIGTTPLPYQVGCPVPASAAQEASYVVPVTVPLPDGGSQEIDWSCILPGSSGGFTIDVLGCQE